MHEIIVVDSSYGPTSTEAFVKQLDHRKGRRAVELTHARGCWAYPDSRSFAMKPYKIVGAVGPDTTTLSVEQDRSERFTIILGGPRSGAALFRQDRLVLYLNRNTPLVWQLIQDDILRASIREGGSCPIHALTLRSLRRRLEDRLRRRPGLPADTSPARHIRVDTVDGRYQLCGPLAGWILNVYSPSGESAGRIRRLPDGYQVSDGRDPFLLLGIALYVLATAQIEERQARQPVLVPGDIVIVQPGHPAPPPFPIPP